MKVVVFDLGGTLMQYVGMPYSWVDFFWDGLELKAEIYSDTIEVLSILKEKGYYLVALTDLPNAMPDEIFKSGISEMLKYLDYYVSSSVAGYRKPHNKGLQMISDKVGIPITELLFVGDEEKDRKTALNAKCKFIHIHRNENMTGGISDLYELLEVIER